MAALPNITSPEQALVVKLSNVVANTNFENVGHEKHAPNLPGFDLGNGDLETAIKETAIFEERNKGEWVAAIGRFENPVAERITRDGWNGLKARVTCGISDKETGFHAAAGDCLWVLISDGKQYLLADMQGVIGLGEMTLKTLMSIKFTGHEEP